MLGHSHAASGIMIGAATAPLLPAGSAFTQLAWVAAVGGASMLPDVDSGGISTKKVIPRFHGASVCQAWGPVTCLLAEGVSKVARGHRNDTHDPILGPVVFGLVAFAASFWFWSSLMFLALMIGVTARSLAFAIPGRIEETWILNLVLSFVAAWWLLTESAGAPVWLPVAVTLGALVHIAGDWPTPGGVPKPLARFRAKRERTSLNLFKTGAPVERWVLAPTFLLVAAVVLYLNVGPLLTTALNMPQPPTVTLNFPDWDTPDFSQILDNLERHVKQ